MPTAAKVAGVATFDAALPYDTLALSNVASVTASLLLQVAMSGEIKDRPDDRVICCKG